MELPRRIFHLSNSLLTLRIYGHAPGPVYVHPIRVISCINKSPSVASWLGFRAQLVEPWCHENLPDLQKEEEPPPSRCADTQKKGGKKMRDVYVLGQRGSFEGGFSSGEPDSLENVAARWGLAVARSTFLTVGSTVKDLLATKWWNNTGGSQSVESWVTTERLPICTKETTRRQ